MYRREYIMYRRTVQKISCTAVYRTEYIMYRCRGQNVSCTGVQYRIYNVQVYSTE